jgi:hypothetical protein
LGAKENLGSDRNKLLSFELIGFISGIKSIFYTKIFDMEQ